MGQKFYTKLQIGVICEACGHGYQYGKFLSDGSEDGLKGKIEKQSFGGKRCPECKYIQSWMSGLWGLPFALFGFLFGTALTIIGFCLLSEKLMDVSGWIVIPSALVLPVAMPFAFLAFGVALEAFNNKRVLKDRTEPEPTVPVARQVKMNFFEELIGSIL